MIYRSHIMRLCRFPYRFSIKRNTGKTIPENAKVSSWPMFAPFPTREAIGPEYHATFIPRAAPRNPKTNAPMAAHPNGRLAGLFQASRSYDSHPFRKIRCSSITTVIWMTVQHPMMLSSVCKVSSKYLAAQHPMTIAATNPNVTNTTRGMRIAHGPRFCACNAKE